jgi:GGDEF domain-containing protein
LIVESVQAVGTERDFVGHIGGDDFVVITDADKAEAVADHSCKRFDEVAPTYYNDEDRLRGYIVSKDRQGNEKHFGLVGVAAAIVTTEKRCFAHIGEIAQVGAELKKKAKEFAKSAWVKDQRAS